MIDLVKNFITKIIEYFINEFDPQTFFVAVIIAFVGYLIKKIFELIKNKHYEKYAFNVSGYWQTEFNSFKFSNDKVKEIYRIKQKGDSISVHIQHIENNTNKIAILYGKGKIRASTIVFYYSTIKKSSEVLGTVLLKIKATNLNEISLIGNFYEDYSNIDKLKQNLISNQIFSNNMFIMQRAHLSLLQRIKFKLRKSVCRF